MSTTIPSNGRPPGTPATSPLDIAIDQTRRFTPSEAAELKIGHYGRSDLQQFRDSRFVTTPLGGAAFSVTRVRDIQPRVGVEIALSLPEVISLFIHAVTMTSARPDLKGATFAIRPEGNDFRVTRLTRGE